MELHPETANGSNQHSSLRKDCEPSERFTANTAAATGQSERTVQREAERGEKVIPHSSIYWPTKVVATGNTELAGGRSPLSGRLPLCHLPDPPPYRPEKPYRKTELDQ